MGDFEKWEDERYVYFRARFSADEQGAAAAANVERSVSNRGFSVIDVAVTGGGTDVGRSIATSALGLGLFAATGFGFVGTSREKGQLVVTFRSFDVVEAQRQFDVQQEFDEALAAADVAPKVWIQEPPSPEQIAAVKQGRAVARARQPKGRCKSHPDADARAFVVQYPERKPRKVALCIECAAVSVALGATLSAP